MSARDPSQLLSRREIKQLLSELDEEKKIRLRLQMEVNDIKKALQSK